jgi:transposase
MSYPDQEVTGGCDVMLGATIKGNESEDFLPGRVGHVGGTATDKRLFVEAVLYRYRAGVPWRDWPERFGDWKNVPRRGSRWAQSQGWETVFQHLAGEADTEYARIDSTIVRAHQHSAGAPPKRVRPKPSDRARADGARRFMPPSMGWVSRPAFS